MKKLTQAQGESGKADMSGNWKAGGGRGLSAFHLKPAPKRSAAFTLIELIGVMAIIGILSAVVLPPLISKIEDANSVGEDAKLEEIARALVAGIKATGTIPNPNRTPYNGQGGGWGDIACKYTTLTSNSVNPGTLHYVFPGEDRSARRVYLDDQFMAYLVTASGAGVNGVFQTPAAGWPANVVTAGGVPLNLANIPLRMYIVSSSKKDLSLSCQANQSGTGTVPSPQPAPGYGAGLIGDLQNWIKKADGPTDPSPGAIKVPDSIAQWGSAYKGGGNYHTRGEFLHVKTIDVRSLFCAVTLTDFPIPEEGQTISSGSGFTPGTPYQGQAAGCSFNFTAPAPAGAVVVGFDIFPPTKTANIAVGPKTLIQRTGLTTTALTGVIPPPDRDIASLNARNTLAAKLLTAPPAPYANAASAANKAAALTEIAAANINELVNLTVPAPAGLTTLQNTYNSAKDASDAAQAAAEAEKIRDPANETAPDNAILDSRAAAASQATASAKTALDAAQAAASAQSAANKNALDATYDNAVNAAKAEEANGSATPQSVASAAANAAANAAAAQVFTSPASFSITIGPPPWWSIAGLAGQQMPTVGNIQTFYVLKGTNLALYDAGAAPAALIMMVQINADSKFEYFNGSWTRVD